jgi:hypothetical protein
MTAERARAIAAAALVLAGCAGVRDSLDQIRGVAPEDGSCSVVVYDSDTARMLSSQAVSGRFAVGFGLGDEHPRKVDVAGVCNGRTTKTFRRLVPGSIGRTEMGNIAP